MMAALFERNLDAAVDPRIMSLPPLELANCPLASVVPALLHDE